MPRNLSLLNLNPQRLPRGSGERGNSLHSKWKLSGEGDGTLSLLIVVVTIVQSLSRVWHFMTPWTVAHQAPLSMGFPGQDYWSGLPFPSPGDLPNPRIKPVSLHWQNYSLPLSPLGSRRYWLADVCVCMLHICMLLQPCPTLWDPVTVAHQAPLSMGFSRQEYWSGLPCPPPGDLPDPGAEPTSLTSPALVGRFFTTSATWENHQLYVFVCICHQ